MRHATRRPASCGASVFAAAFVALALHVCAEEVIIEAAKDEMTCKEWRSTNCCRTCESSCCNEGDPQRQCSGCGPELKCHPGAECYELSDPVRKYAAFKDVTGTDESDKPPGSACQHFCKDTGGIGCCNFSTPFLECGGCDETNECSPAAKCYSELKPEL